MTKISIHQSQYLPWPPYFKKIAMSNIFVVMDNVQFQKNGVQNRNKVRNKNDDFWLTIPISGQFTDTIVEKKLTTDNWAMKHWKSVHSSYSASPRWGAYAQELEFLYMQHYSTLQEVNDAFFCFFMKHLNIRTKVVYLSELQVSGAKSELVLNICRMLKADTYISGLGSKGYLDERSFENAEIKIDYIESVPPVYQQYHGEFMPGLSMLDMLLNTGQTKLNEYLFGD